MKSAFYFAALTILLGICASNSTNQDGKISDSTAENKQSTSESVNKKSSGFWEPLVWNEYKDNNGTVIAAMPFPASWKIAAHPAKGEPSISGPNGVRVTDFPLQSFMYTNDPQMQQVYYQSGQQVRAMPGIEQLIQQDIVPWAANRGLQYVRHYEVPEVSKVDKWYNDQLYKAVPGQSEIMAIGSEWKSSDGSPYFLLIHLNVSATAQLMNWYYYCTGLEAEKTNFEKAKKQLIFALGNTHYPLEPILAYNQREAEKAGRSWAEFNQRMVQNQANFEAQQRAFVNKSNAINDAIMNGWRANNAASDKQQEQRVDGIYERTNVADPSNGQRYKVAAGANQYWMNSNGEYISTDRHDYNPNLDENMNEQRWQELNEVK